MYNDKYWIFFSSECPARRFECECKKVFSTKEQLGVHIFKQHSEDKVSKGEEQEVAFLTYYIDYAFVGSPKVQALI